MYQSWMCVCVFTSYLIQQIYLCELAHHQPDFIPLSMLLGGSLSFLIKDTNKYMLMVTIRPKWCVSIYRTWYKSEGGGTELFPSLLNNTTMCWSWAKRGEIREVFSLSRVTYIPVWQYIVINGGFIFSQHFYCVGSTLPGWSESNLMQERWWLHTENSTASTVWEFGGSQMMDWIYIWIVFLLCPR